MRTLVLAAALSAATLGGCTTYSDYYDDDYDYARAYRTGNYYPYVLNDDDVIYRGSDGRYYCKRRDGTVGLVVGAGAGALIGSAISRGALGTILGAVAGGAIGRSVDRGMSCE